jgi:hypothetical protein
VSRQENSRSLSRTPELPTVDDYLYVTKRYCELNSDVIYVSDMHRENFELKLDTKDLLQKADPETPPAAATKQETPQTETPPAKVPPAEQE